MQFTFGADPEVFVSKLGKLVSGFGLVPGDKANPYPVSKGAVQVDGMALEFNIDPCNSEDMFYENITTVMEQLAAMVPDYKLEAIPVANFGAAYIEAQPYEARELGCEADYNAWENGVANSNPNMSAPFRTGAGHIHIGWTTGADIRCPSHVEDCIRIIKQMDFFLGLPSLLFDSETQRRQLYGTAGAFRVKPYGTEYRVLSNKWVSDPLLIRWAYRAANAAMVKFVEGDELSLKYGDISEIINTSDVERALEIINLEGLELPNYVG